MATKLSRQVITVCSSLAFIGGCTQILGISDYEIDPKLGATATAGGEGGDGTGTGNRPGTSGEATAGGEPSSHGGAPSTPQGGEPPVGSAGAAGEVSAGGAAPVGGVLVACDSLDCCTKLGGTAVGVEILKDGGFELGTPDDGSPWIEETTTASNEVMVGDDSFGFIAHTGDWYAYLSGLSEERSTLYSPDFVVPKDAGWMTISGWRIFQIDTQDEINEDFCGIALYTHADTDPLELPFFWGRPSDHPDGWADTPTWKRFEASWDAVPHQGQKRYLGLRGESDDYTLDADLNSSSFLFDDVSLKVYRCYK